MKKLYILLLSFLITAVSYGQTTLFQESFETGNSATQSVTCNDGFSDFFTRTDGSDINTNYMVNGMDGSFFFAAQDIDATECGGSGSIPETLDFTGINISGFTNITLALLVAEDDSNDGNEDWDSTDNLIITYQIDGGGYVNALAFESTGASNTAPALDTDFDGIGDGTVLTASFQEFTATIPSGTTLDLKIAFAVNSGDEDVAIDNIRVVDGFLASPVILTSSGITDLNYVSGSGPSAEGSFTVEGSNLTNDITVTPPTNFELSTTSGSGFSGSAITLAQASGAVSSTTIYARLKSALAVGNYSENVTTTSTGADPKTISLSGDVFNPPTNSMIITGVYDAQNNSAPKGVEVYVTANISDLSIYGIGTANNGGGSDGQEFTFPAVTANAGDRFFIASESTEFTAFFGEAPDYTSNAMGINGDDAIELFESGQVIDTFGDINTDGSGEAWDYLDGWAYRVSNTGPDGSNFVLANWTFSGVTTLDGTTNANSTNSYPYETYSLSTEEISLTKFNLYPNPTNTGSVNISSTNTEAINVQVFDILGKQVKNETLSNSTLNVSNLKTGVYIVKISQNNGSTTKKLVIK